MKKRLNANYTYAGKNQIEIFFCFTDATIKLSQHSEAHFVHIHTNTHMPMSHI